jgi:hypothetical protein
MSGAGYAEHFTRHLRLTILLILTEAPGYAANDSVIATSAQGMGLAASRDRVRTELVWLEEQGLLAIAEPSPGVRVATINQRGHDVAGGLASCPGVQRPSPKG